MDVCQRLASWWRQEESASPKTEPSSDNAKEESGENSLLRQQGHSITNTSETTPLWIEFTLAVYFLIDSVGVVFHLTRNEVHLLANGMMFDVVVSMLAYLYMVYRQLADWRKTNLGQCDEQINSNREIV